METKTPPTRRQRNRAATIASILEAARAIMREQGVAALSMHELARRMDMRAPSLYNYFTGRMDLYDALFRLGFSLWQDKFERSTATSSGIREEMRDFMTGYMEFALENPELYQLCFERPVPGFVPSQASLDLSLGILNRARRRVGQHRNEWTSDLSASRVVDLVIAIAHGLTAMHIANEPGLPLGKGRFGSLIPVALSMLEENLLVKGETE